MKLNFQFLAFAFALVLTYCSSSIAQSPTPRDWVQQNIKPLSKLYLHFHQNPELSFEERETAARLAKELSDVGITVTKNVGGHGVVGILENGAGPTVMIRTDLDALPITEATNLPYASKVKVTDADGLKVGVMHACGHDVHMTTLVGRSEIPGKEQGPMVRPRHVHWPTRRRTWLWCRSDAKRRFI